MELLQSDQIAQMQILPILILAVVGLVFCAVFLAVYRLGERWAERGHVPHPIPPQIAYMGPQAAILNDPRTEYERYLAGEVEDPRR